MTILFTLALAAQFALAGTLIDDRFAAPTLAGRDLAPGRGIWKIADGAATCTQDDALFAKNKNHGPAMWYKTSFTDATVRFAVRAEKVREFVFTLNDEQGHVFRFVVGKTPLSVRAWKGEGHEAKAEGLRVKDAPTLPEGQWTQVELKFSGDQCAIVFGDKFKQTFTHPAIAKKKTTLGLGFSFGTLAVRDVSVVTP